MYERVLVPLDGSELAEGILPIAQKLVGPLDAELILLRVVQPISPAEALASAAVVTPDTYALREMDAKRYLLEMERRLAKHGLHVRTCIAVGAPAETIVAAAQS